jgi:uncharacterized protein YbjQ (UPF0145 family)
MKKTVSLTAAFLALACTTGAFARDTPYQISLAEVLQMPEAQAKLDKTVRFYLSGQKTPAIAQSFGEDVSSRKANGASLEDEAGCKRATLSALIALQEKAKKLGANAVVDMHSFYKKNPSKSDSTVECHAGAFVIGVALKGTYATVAGE